MQWQGKNGLTSPPHILLKMWSPGTQPSCTIPTAIDLAIKAALNFHPQDHVHSLSLHPNTDSGPFYKISRKKNMQREQEKQHKLKPYSKAAKGNKRLL